MKIVRLTSENVLRLLAVQINPEGNLIVVGGDNAQGKTSVLDSIMLAMGGRQAKHKKPLHAGAKKGYTEVELDNDLVVKRTFTAAGGGTLTVSNKAGSATYKSPQKMLDNLIGQLSFDPLRWASMGDGDQLTLLKEMLGLDFTTEDEQRKGHYESRKEVNRAIGELTANINDVGDTTSAPEAEVIVDDLLATLDEMNEHNQTVKNRKQALANDVTSHGGYIQDVADVRTEISDLETQLEGAKLRLKTADETMVAAGKKIEDDTASMPKPVDVAPVKQRISDAQSVNALFADKKKKLAMEEKLLNANAEATGLTEKIKAIDEAKAKKMAETEFPIEGMSFDETGVTYNSIPFSQCSQAEKLRVSLTMGVKMNPDLKVILIRDGSLLDDKNMKMVAEIADKSGHQVWLERVGKGDECQVIIEDGRVLGADGCPVDPPEKSKPETAPPDAKAPIEGEVVDAEFNIDEFADSIPVHGQDTDGEW